MDTAVITLPHRKDRRDTFDQYAQEAHLRYRWFPGVQEDPPPSWQDSAGAWGCARSHEKLLRSGRTDLLVLEDDARVPPNFLEEFVRLYRLLPEFWRVFKLGGQHRTPPCALPSPGLVQCTWTFRTHAYFVRGSVRQELADLAADADMAWDTAFGSHDTLQQNYAPEPFLVSVFPSPSDIAGSATHPDLRVR